MTTKKRSSVGIAEERKMKLEMLAIEASYKAGKPIKWTDIINYLIDNYAKEAAKDLAHSTNK